MRGDSGNMNAVPKAGGSYFNGGSSSLDDAKEVVLLVWLGSALLDGVMRLLTPRGSAVLPGLLWPTRLDVVPGLAGLLGSPLVVPGLNASSGNTLLGFEGRMSSSSSTQGTLRLRAGLVPGRVPDLEHLLDVLDESSRRGKPRTLSAKPLTVLAAMELPDALGKRCGGSSGKLGTLLSK